MINVNCIQFSITDDHSSFREMSPYWLIPALCCGGVEWSDLGNRLFYT